MLEERKEGGRTRMVHAVASRFVALYRQMQVSLQAVGVCNSSLSPDGEAKVEQGENWIDARTEM